MYMPGHMHRNIELNIDVGSFTCTLARVRVRGHALELNACVRVYNNVVRHLRNVSLQQTCNLSLVYVYPVIVLSSRYHRIYVTVLLNRYAIFCPTIHCSG